MQVTRSAAVAMFEALGIKTASKWNSARLAGKVSKLNTMVDEDTDISGKEKTLLNQILAANEAGEEIDFVEEGDGEEKPAKKKGSKKTTKANTETEETSDADVPVKTKKTVKAKKGAKNGEEKQGVLDVIVNILKKGSAKRPVSKESAIEQMITTLPDRYTDSPSSAKTSFMSAGRVALERRGIEIKHNDKGYWID